MGMDPLSSLWQALLDLPRRIDAGLQSLIQKPLPATLSGPVRPADVTRQLSAAMLAPENVLEDAQYSKIVPNIYLVELNPANYARNYQPLETQVREQWKDALLLVLNTTNQRQGRREYRFAGPVQIQLQPAADLAPGQVRVRCQVQLAAQAAQAAEAAAPAKPPPAYLELLPGGRQWALREGVQTIGRDPACNIALDLPRLQQKPLVSSQHAHIRGQGADFRLFDGAPGGHASLNGTFVNGRRVPPEGHLLQDGDLIILAAADPRNPRADAPGVAALFFVKPQ